MKIRFENYYGEGNAILDRDFEENEIAEAFGRSLKTLREYKKLSLRDLSKEVDIPNPTLSRYESGQNIPSITQGIKICGFFDMNIESFVQYGLMDKYGVTIKGMPDNIIGSYEKTQNAKKLLQKNPEHLSLEEVLNILKNGAATN